jgi:hypothetical protein
MVESLHGGVDDAAGILGSLICEVEVDHGGLEAGVTHVSLDDSRVHTCFEKMGGIAVPEGVNRDTPLGDAGSGLGFSEGSLGAIESHGSSGCRAFVSSPAQSGEDEHGVSVSNPVAAQELVGLFRQGHVAVFGSLAAMHMDHHALAVYVGYLQGKSLRDPESTGIDRGMEGIVVESSEVVENGKDLFLAQDAGKPLLSFGFEVGEDVPLALEYIDKEELDAAVGNAKSGGRPLAYVPTMEEIVFQLHFRNLIRALAVVLNEDAYGTGIALLGAFAHSGKLKGSDGLLDVIFHGNSPLCNEVLW